MTAAFKAGALARHGISALWLFGSVSLAQAGQFHYSTPQVAIDFDTDGFSLSRDTSYSGSEVIDPSFLTFTQVGDGVQVDFNGFMSVLASSYTNYSYESLSASFSAPFNFTAQPGYAITGYAITYAGSYSIESPGSVSGWAPSVILSANSGGDTFSITGLTNGPMAPLIQGGLNAMATVNTIQVFDGFVQVFDHYNQVLDYCDNDEPFTCYYHDEPVYVDVAAYHDEMDLGQASIDVNRITIQAQVAAVPEANGLAMLLAGLPIAAGLARRRFKPASAGSAA